MTWVTITGAGTTTATKFHGDAMNKISNMFNGTDVTDTVSINTAVTWTFEGTAFRVRDSDDSHSYIFSGSNLAADRTVTLPLLTGNDTLVAEAHTATLTNKTIDGDNNTISNLAIGSEVSATVGADIEMAGYNIQEAGVIFLKEQADADTDVSGEGQIWVNTATPNELWFTDDAGTDFQLASKTGTHAKTEAIGIAVGDETTVLTTGTGKVEFQMPYAFTLTDVRATVTTAPTTDAGFTVDINEGGTSILSTKLTIDATAKTSATATTPAVISDSSLADSAVITVDIDGLSTGATETGLKIWLIGYQT